MTEASESLIAARIGGGLASVIAAIDFDDEPRADGRKIDNEPPERHLPPMSLPPPVSLRSPTSPKSVLGAQRACARMGEVNSCACELASAACRRHWAGDPGRVVGSTGDPTWVCAAVRDCRGRSAQGSVWRSQNAANVVARKSAIVPRTRRLNDLVFPWRAQRALPRASWRRRQNEPRERARARLWGRPRSAGAVISAEREGRARAEHRELGHLEVLARSALRADGGGEHPR
jgi:hypothetical protein